MTIYFDRLGFPFGDYPELTGGYERIHARPGLQQTNVEPWVTRLPARR